MIIMRRLLVLCIFAVIGLSVLWAVDDNNRRKYDTLFLEAMMQRQKGNADAAFDLLRRCVEIDSTQAAAYFYLSLYYQGLKDSEKSLACLEKATNIDTDNVTYHEKLAEAYVAANRIEECKTELEALRRIDPTRDDLDGTLVELYKQTADYKSAIRLLSDMERANGKSEELSEMKSEIYTLMRDKKSAIKEMKELSLQYPNDLNLKVKYAVTLMNNAQEKKGLAIINEVLKEEPDNMMAQYSKMDHAIINNDDATAEQMAIQLLMNKNADTRTRAYLLQSMANQYANSGKDSTAILEKFDQVIAMPNADPAIAMMKATYMEAKDMPVDLVNTAYEKVLDMDPGNAAARLRLVQNAWQAEDKDKVIDLCSQARIYNPEEMVFYYFQGISYYQKEDEDKALDAFQNGISVINENSEPGIVSDFYAMMGDILHKKGMKAEAFAAYDSCLQWKDDNIGALNNYAYYLSETSSELEKAEQMSYKTIKKEPENSTFLDTYAWILFLEERYSEAKIYIDQAVQHLDTTEVNHVIYEHAGDIYYHTGNVDGAVDLWEKAADTDADNAVLARKIKMRKYVK